MSTAVQKRSNSYYVHTAIALFFMFIFGHIAPPIGKITPMGMQVLGVFLGMLWGWIFIEMIWPSLLGIIAFGMTGATTVTAAFSSGWGYNMVLTVLMMLLFSELLNQCKITDYIAEKCLSAKFIIGKPWLLVIMFFVADFLISVLASNLAATFILWVAFLKAAEMAGYQKGDREVTFMVCGILFVGVISLMVVPFKTAALVFVGFLTSGTGLTVEYVPYTIFMFVMCVLQIALLLVVGKFVLKLDYSKFADSEDRFAHMRGKKATYEQKVGIVFIVAFICLLFLPAFLPKGAAITTLLNNWGILGCSGLFLVIGCILKNSNGEKFADIATICKQGISWDIIWLLVATFPIADAIKSPDCGIMATVMTVVSPLLQGMSPVVFMIVCAVVLGVLTQFVHNVVLAAMFIPMMTGICAELGGNAIVMFFMLYLALQAAYATPGASMQAAMMFGHEWVPRKDGYLFGILYLVITLVVAFVVGIPLGNMLW